MVLALGHGGNWAFYRRLHWRLLVGNIMMQATGTLFLSKTPPLATVATDGTFNLTMLAYDRLGPLKVEAWRVIFAGPVAQAFWKAYKDNLKPGAAIYVELESIRCVAQPLPRSPEFQAQVMHITLARANRDQPTSHAQQQPEATAK